jgi:hypothetical protein
MVPLGMARKGASETNKRIQQAASDASEQTR